MNLQRMCEKLGLPVCPNCASIALGNCFIYIHMHSIDLIGFEETLNLTVQGLKQYPNGLMYLHTAVKYNCPEYLDRLEKLMALA